MTLLIAGGELDPNLAQIAKACQSLGVSYVECRHGRGSSPEFEWNLSSGEVRVNGQNIQPAGAFIRHDVFEGLADSRSEVAVRALAWHQAVNGWLLSSSAVRVFNRHQVPEALSKPAVLVAARDSGLVIPDTVISNLQSTIKHSASHDGVTKPVAGGDYCYQVKDVLERTEFRGAVASCPAFLQPRLVAPEVRVYVIGDYDFAFEMRSPSLDYRLHQDAEVVPLQHIPPVAGPLRVLMSRLRMDYGAADFKTDPITGELVFLELNTSPMLARFDIEAKGAISAAIVDVLSKT